MIKDIKIQIVVKRAHHQQMYAHALAQGMRRHGFKNIEIIPNFDERKQPDLVVTWAYKRIDVINYCRRNNKPHLVMERAYIGDRHHWVSLGYNGLNGRADFLNECITSTKRFEKHFKQYDTPFKNNDNGYILVCGQVEGDMSHRHVNINNWYRTVVSELSEQGHDVRFRAHPLSKERIETVLDGLEYKLDKNSSLEVSLKDARTCVTFSSNSGVIAALNGVSVVAYDEGSMCYDVAAHDISNLDYKPDKTQWLSKLAYCQWLPQELENGEAWLHLMQMLKEK